MLIYDKALVNTSELPERRSLNVGLSAFGYTLSFLTVCKIGHNKLSKVLTCVEDILISV